MPEQRAKGAPEPRATGARFLEKSHATIESSFKGKFEEHIPIVRASLESFKPEAVPAEYHARLDDMLSLAFSYHMTAAPKDIAPADHVNAINRLVDDMRAAVSANPADEFDVADKRMVLRMMGAVWNTPGEKLVSIQDRLHAMHGVASSFAFNSRDLLSLYMMQRADILLAVPKEPAMGDRLISGFRGVDEELTPEKFAQDNLRFLSMGADTVRSTMLYLRMLSKGGRPILPLYSKDALPVVGEIVRRPKGLEELTKIIDDRKLFTEFLKRVRQDK